MKGNTRSFWAHHNHNPANFLHCLLALALSLLIFLSISTLATFCILHINRLVFAVLSPLKYLVPEIVRTAVAGTAGAIVASIPVFSAPAIQFVVNLLPVIFARIGLLILSTVFTEPDSN